MAAPFASTKPQLTTAVAPVEEAAAASVAAEATTKMVAAVAVTKVVEDTVCLPISH